MLNAFHAIVIRISGLGCGPASSAGRLSTAHDAVKLFSLVPNSLKWRQRMVSRPVLSLHLLSLLSPAVELLLNAVCRWKHDQAPNSKRKTKTCHDASDPTVRRVSARGRESTNKSGYAADDAEDRVSKGLPIQNALRHESEQQSK
jgi:hypothetical protein